MANTPARLQSGLLAPVVLVLAAGLAACGGGGGGTDPAPPRVEVQGLPVKGPLANARVQAFEADPAVPGLAFQGEPVAEGTTDQHARITGLAFPQPLAPLYLIRVTAQGTTVDLSTGGAPLLDVLEILVPAAHVANGAGLYPSPLTTLAVRLVAKRAAAEPVASLPGLEAAFDAALDQVRLLVGSGLPANVDVTTVPPVLGEATADELRDRVAHRTAIEAVGAMLARLGVDTGEEPSALLAALADDLADGSLDGQGTLGPVVPFVGLGDVAAYFAALPVPHLPIPGSDVDGDPTTSDPLLVSQVLAMMETEMAALGMPWSGPPDGADIAFTPATLGPDNDGDGWPDPVDDDDDNDGVPDDTDQFPFDPAESADHDGDGIGDNADDDDDNDGYPDSIDAFPLDAGEHRDHDGDGIGDNADDDDDNDGIPDVLDPTLGLLELSGVAADTAIDRTRGAVYVTVPASKSLHRLDAVTGQVLDTWTFDYTPERMAISPDDARLYVALLAQPHSSYWWEEDQYGFIAVLDLASGVLVTQYRVPTDPYDLVVNSAGKLVVSSGSGQWSEIYAFNAATGAVLGKASIRQQSRLALHPNQQWVYAADTDLSPADMERFNIGGPGIQAAWESVYHGDHRIAGNLYITPDGQRIIARGGDVFTAAAAQSADMRFVRALTPDRVESVTFDPVQKVVVTLERGANDWFGTGPVWLRAYSLETLERISQQQIPEGGAWVVPSPAGFLVLGPTAGGGTAVSRVNHPCPDCGANTAPTAVLAVTPETGGDTTTTYLFDASASSDAESGLEYRWDWNSDGVYDTDFLPPATASRTFNLAGTKVVTVQVRDAGGLLGTATRSINVAQGIDPGTPGDGGAAFELQFAPADAQYDRARQKLYLTHRDGRRLYFVDAITGFVEKYFEFSNMPERLALSPDGTTLYVALLTRDHSSYWWEEEQEGYVAVFDLEAGVKTREFRTTVDPYDLVATDAGKVVVSSGSGQWTWIEAYQAGTGQRLGQASIRQASRLSLHPNQQWVYSADTDVSPSDLAKFDIGAAGITYVRQSPYHGDHRIAGNVYVTPDGNHLITRGGDVFRATGDAGTDMVFVRGMATGIVEDLWFDIERNLIFTLERPSYYGASATLLRHYNLQTFEPVGSSDLGADGRFVFVPGDTVMALAVQTGSASVIEQPHPCPDCGNNAAPVAAFSVTPPDGTTNDDFVFDAAATTDPGDTLLYRWDWESDGNWDTDFSPESQVTRRFSIAGTKQVRLQVKDTAGALDEASTSVAVTFAPDPGTPGAGGQPFELQYAPADLIHDQARSRLYVTDKAGRRLQVVDTTTGTVSREFRFDAMPERMVMAPDGTRLYVALLVREHSAYWWDESQSGYIAEFGLDPLEKTGQYAIGMDPYDLAVTDAGKLVVTGGSGQWTSVQAYVASTGQFLGEAGIRQASRMALHPNQAWVYTADTDVSPSDIRKYSVAGPGITSLYDSPYHGDYRMGGNVWVEPDGQYLVTAGGDVFTSSAVQAQDMVYLRSLTDGTIIDLYFDVPRKLIVTLERPTWVSLPVLRYYQVETGFRVGEVPLATGDRVYADGDYISIVSGGAASTLIARIGHPCPDCGTNSTPTADLVVSPGLVGDTTTRFGLDAGGSTDAEDALGALRFRWDWESDGAWDTAFDGAPAVTHRYILPGIYTVTMQVVDRSGAAATASAVVTVAQGIDPGTGVTEPGMPWVLPFRAQDAALSATNERLYLTAPADQRIYVLNLADGLLEKYFESPGLPERMAMTPAGDRLYVSQPLAPHSYYDPYVPNGFVAEFDPVAGTRLRDLAVDLDPYDLVANGSGKLVVSSGSNQWTAIHAYQLSDGALVGQAGIRHQSRLALHPGGDWVYAADTDVWPSDIRKYDIQGAGILALYDSRYHGDHRMAGNVYVAPDGTWLLTRGGDVFTSASTQASDMLYLGGLTTSLVCAAAFDTASGYLATLESSDSYNCADSTLRYYRISDRGLVQSVPLLAPGIDVVIHAGKAYAVLEDLSGLVPGSRIEAVPLPQ